MSRQRKHHRSLESKNQLLIFPCLELMWLQTKHTGQDFQKQLQELILWMSSLRFFRSTWLSKSTYLTCFGKSALWLMLDTNRLSYSPPNLKSLLMHLAYVTHPCSYPFNGNKNAYLSWLSHQLLCPYVMDERTPKSEQLQTCINHWLEGAGVHLWTVALERWVIYDI